MPSGRATVALKNIKANPFKKYVLKGHLDPTKIATLEASVKQTEFWDNLYGRRNKDGEIELAYGHKRLAAAIHVLGKNYETSIKISDLTDTQMLQAMATENATAEEESIQARVDVALLARKHVKESPAACKCKAPGSVRCVAALLGWSEDKISELFKLDDRLHPEILPYIKEHTGLETVGKRDSGTLGQRSAAILASLADGPDDTVGKGLQKKVFTILQKAPSRVTHDDVSRVVRTIKKEPPGRRESVAIAEAQLVVEEVKTRGRARDLDPPKKGRQPEDVTQRMARMMPHVGGIIRGCDEILELLDAFDENPLLNERYLSDVTVGNWRRSIKDIYRKSELMFQPRNRRALHA